MLDNTDIIRAIIFANPAEQQLYAKRYSYSYPHGSPNSCLVASIGTMWSPGAWAKVADMVMYTRQQGFNCWWEELSDTSSVNQPMTNTMRNDALLKASSIGVEYVLALDNDALPEPDMLVRLMNAEVTCIAPFISDTRAEEVCIGSPRRPTGQSQQPMKWVPFTALLLHTSILNCIGVRPFTDTGNEGQFFRLLARYGHRVWMDTDNQLLVASPPSYPGELSWD